MLSSVCVCVCVRWFVVHLKEKHDIVYYHRNRPRRRLHFRRSEDASDEPQMMAPTVFVEKK